jgi:hypothetical protein
LPLDEEIYAQLVYKYIQSRKIIPTKLVDVIDAILVYIRHDTFLCASVGLVRFEEGDEVML